MFELCGVNHAFMPIQIVSILMLTPVLTKYEYTDSKQYYKHEFNSLTNSYDLVLVTKNYVIEEWTYYADEGDSDSDWEYDGFVDSSVYEF